MSGLSPITQLEDEERRSRELLEAHRAERLQYGEDPPPESFEDHLRELETRWKEAAERLFHARRHRGDSGDTTGDK
jgi:hypothetical protein